MSTITIGTRAEEARRRTVKDAQRHLKTELPRRWKGRAEALDAIACHHTPMRRAREIVAHQRRLNLFGAPVSTIPAPAVPKIRRTKHRLAQLASEKAAAGGRHKVGPGVAYWWPRDQEDAKSVVAEPADVQELAARLIKRDGVVCSTIGSMLQKLDRQVAAGLSRDAFEDRAAMILSTPSALPALSASGAESGAPAAPPPPPMQPLYVDRYGFRHRSPAGDRKLVA
jgi:hypothetical protein